MRDPKSWYKSVTDSIYQFHTLIQTSWTIPLLMSMLDRRKGAGRQRKFTNLKRASLESVWKLDCDWLSVIEVVPQQKSPGPVVL